MAVPPAAVVSVAEVASVTGTASPTGFEPILKKLLRNHESENKKVVYAIEIEPL